MMTGRILTLPWKYSLLARFSSMRQHAQNFEGVESCKRWTVLTRQDMSTKPVLSYTCSLWFETKPKQRTWLTMISTLSSRFGRGEIEKKKKARTCWISTKGYHEIERQGWIKAWLCKHRTAQEVMMCLKCRCFDPKYFFFTYLTLLIMSILCCCNRGPVRFSGPLRTVRSLVGESDLPRKMSCVVLISKSFGHFKSSWKCLFETWSWIWIWIEIWIFEFLEGMFWKKNFFFGLCEEFQNSNHQNLT